MSKTTVGNLTSMAKLASTPNDDMNGAMIYIFGVLLWYSMGVVFVLGMQMLGSSEDFEDLARRRSKYPIGKLRDHATTKEILEELVNKQNRGRLWDIYLGATCERKDRLTQAETIRIRHIEKQLATIKRNHRLIDDIPASPLTYEKNLSDISSNSLSIAHRHCSTLETSPMDQLEELIDRTKSAPQLQSNLRRLIIRKSFKKSSRSFSRCSNRKPASDFLHSISVDES